MSKQNNIISAITFNPQQVKYTKIRINPSGGKSVGILNEDQALLISTPTMLSWGVNKFKDDKTGKISYDLALQFPNNEYNTDALNKFLENMKAFEDKLKQDALKNCKEWLGKPKMSTEVIDALFHPMLKYPKDKKTEEVDYTRAPSLKVKIECWENKFSCEVYNYEQKQLFPANDASEERLMELIPKSSNIAVILKCGGLWFANGKFGCTWKLVQAAVKVKESLKGKCLFSMSDFDQPSGSGNSGANNSSASSSSSSSGSGLELLNDSDNEADVEQEHDAEVEVEQAATQQQEVKAEVAKAVEAADEKKTVATKKVIRRKTADA
jgi:hypothetical protein